MGNIDVQCWRHLQTYLHKKYRNWCQHTYCKSWYIYEWAQAESKPIQPFLTTRQVSNIKNINFYSLFPILPIWWWTTPRLNIGRGISIFLSCKQSYLLDKNGGFPIRQTWRMLLHTFRIKHWKHSEQFCSLSKQFCSLSIALTESLEPYHWVTVGFLDVLVHGAPICKDPLTEGAGELLAKM